MDPFDFFDKVQKELGKQFERFDRSFLKDYRKPSCDISQDKNNIKINAELPGIAKKDVMIHVGKHDIEIRAEMRKKNIKKKKGEYEEKHVHKGYHRIIPIPTDVIPEKAQAKFKRGGVVSITIPKAKKTIHRIRVR